MSGYEGGRGASGALSLFHNSAGHHSKRMQEHCINAPENSHPSLNFTLTHKQSENGQNL